MSNKADSTATSPWRSPMLSSGTKDQLIIPRHGWYGFCFGGDDIVGKRQHENVATDDNDDSTVWRLVVVDSSNDNDTNKVADEDEGATGKQVDDDGNIPSSGETIQQWSTVGSFNLPFFQKGTTIALNDVHIGQLMYLPKGIKLNVVHQAALQSSKEKEEDSTTVATKKPRTAGTTTEPESIPICQWRVILQRDMEGRALPAYLQTRTTNNDTTIHDDEDNGDRDTMLVLSQSKKSLVCGICAKTFATNDAIQNHLDRVHLLERLNASSSPLTTANNHANGDSVATADDPTKMWTRPLEVVYQDRYMAVIVKPQGMPVMGTTPSLMKSNLLMALVHHHGKGKTGGSLLTDDGNDKDSVLGKPRPCHRLDAATGGLLVVAKTRNAERELRASFANRDCHKQYTAVVRGKLEILRDDSNFVSPTAKEKRTDGTLEPATAILSTSMLDDGSKIGIIDSPVSLKPSKSMYRPVRHIRTSAFSKTKACLVHRSRTDHLRDSWMTVVDLWPITGRQHQLRKHMKLIGHSIVGDHRYGGTLPKVPKPGVVVSDGQEARTSADNASMSKTIRQEPELRLSLDRMYLWAVELEIPHPGTKKKEVFSLPWTDDWIDRILREELEHGTD